MWRPTLPRKTRRNTRLVLLLSGAAQLALLAWSAYVDAHPAAFGGLRYTDVDWRVVYDGLQATARPATSPATGPLAPALKRAGLAVGSPYARATFRYTPLLALLLAPALLAEVAGRLLLVGYTLAVSAALDSQVDGAGWWTLHALWSLNPVVLNISTRGSPEAIPCLLTVALLVSLRRAGLSAPARPARAVTVRKGGKVIADTKTAAAAQQERAQQRWADAAAAALALAASYKIYPAIYVPALWAALARKHGGWLAAPVWRFGAVAAASAAALNGALYAVWGHEFLHETFLYHLSRADHRHNFSVYFLPIYLARFAAPEAARAGLAGLARRALRSPLASFLPQIGLVALTGFLAPVSTEMTMFLQTCEFVVFNKVCTSQYFLWPLPFIPLLSFPSLSWARLGVALAGWVAAQAAWLSFAYRLEFLGEPTYLALWGSGLGLLAVSAWGLGQLILGAAPPPPARPKSLKVE